MPRYALVGVVSACVLFGAGILPPAWAQDGHQGQGHAENHDWYQELKQPGTGYSCCTGTVNGIEGDCRPTRAYLTDEGHNIPHLMFYTRVKDGKDWGSGAAGSPVMSSPYWFVAPTEHLQMKGLPPILVFLVAVTNWSDGTPAGQHAGADRAWRRGCCRRHRMERHQHRHGAAAVLRPDAAVLGNTFEP